MIKTKTKIKNVIFDLDGTLIDSSYDVVRILKEVINRNGGRVDENTKIQIGPPLFDMVKNTVPHFSDEIARKVVEEYRVIYENDELKNTRPYSGIVDVLRTLKNNNIKMFIATYKPKVLAIKTLNRYFNNLYIDVATPSEIVDFSNRKTKTDILNWLISKWNINPEESVMVGDAKSDIICARSVGMYTVGALWGYGHENEFDFADEKLDSVKELELLMGKLIKG